MSERRFRRLAGDDAADLTFEFDGQSIPATLGESVAAALLAAGIDRFRTTPVRGMERGPFCLIGACFDCLLEIDGEPNQQACMTLVRNGMRVRPTRGVRPIDDLDRDVNG